jgi:hypothetical protein
VAEGAARQPGELGLQLADRATGEVAYGLADSVDDLVEQIAVLVQVLQTFRGELIHLLAVGLDAAHVALVLQHLKGRVDGPGRGV